MIQEIQSLGERYERTAKADKLVGDLQKSIDAVEIVAANRKGPSVLILFICRQLLSHRAEEPPVTLNQESDFKIIKMSEPEKKMGSV